MIELFELAANPNPTEGEFESLSKASNEEKSNESNYKLTIPKPTSVSANRFYYLNSLMQEWAIDPRYLQ